MADLPRPLVGRFVDQSPRLVYPIRAQVTIRELRDYINGVPEDFIDNGVNVSDGVGFSLATRVGFYKSGELYIGSGNR
jgi:hypothetical protein